MNLKNELSEFINFFIKSNFINKIILIIKLAFFLLIIWLPIGYLLNELTSVPTWLTLFPLLFVEFVLEIAILFEIYYPLSTRIVRVRKLSKNDFIKSENYYRELIDNYCLIELSYIDDFKISKNKDIVVLLLNMESKGILSLKGTKITILDTSKVSKKSEDYILNLIMNNQLKELDIKELESMVKKDCLDDNLVKKTNYKEQVIFIVAIELILVTLSIVVNSNIIHIAIFILALFIAIRNNPQVRTKKGKEINQKLEGLKLFLKDFGQLNNKVYEEIELWEDYLIYSVLFNQNKKIVKEISDKYLNF